MAQFYNIHNYRDYSCRHIATLTSGLPSDSRIVKHLTGNHYDQKTQLLGLIIDLIQNYFWARAGKSGDPPLSLFRMFSNTADETFGFDTAEEFEIARKAILEG